MLCAFTRPIYQVSVYRTISPLVYICKNKDADQLQLGMVALQAAVPRSILASGTFFRGKIISFFR